MEKVEKEIRKKSLFREYAEAIVISAILALLIRTFVVQAFKIPSGSMIPTLLIGDHILVNKFIYKFKDPERGDLVVFKYPLDQKRDFIKRVIGLPGEKLEIKDKEIYIDDTPLDEPYAVFKDNKIQSRVFSKRDNYGPVTVPEGHLFVMGDNRDNSMDSRFWGFLDMKLLRGEAFIIYWSWDSKHFGVRWNRFAHLLY